MQRVDPCFPLSVEACKMLFLSPISFQIFQCPLHHLFHYHKCCGFISCCYAPDHTPRCTEGTFCHQNIGCHCWWLCTLSSFLIWSPSLCTQLYIHMIECERIKCKIHLHCNAIHIHTLKLQRTCSYTLRCS